MEGVGVVVVISGVVIFAFGSINCRFVGLARCLHREG